MRCLCFHTPLGMPYLFPTTEILFDHETLSTVRNTKLGSLSDSKDIFLGSGGERESCNKLDLGFLHPGCLLGKMV